VKNVLKRLGLWDRVRRSLPAGLRGHLRNAAYQPRKALTISPADRNRLVEYYREDVNNLSTLLNRHLSHWLDPGHT
jgi:hypothetical protein